MSRWAKSEEELKWRVVICMCWHKMARLRPFPLNADASGRAHRLNWWCTTSWMRGTKAQVDSCSRSSSLPETVDSSTENSSVVSREPAVITKFRWTWNKFIFALCRGHRRTSDDWSKTCSCTESWLKHEEMTVNLGSLFFEPSDHIYTAAAADRQLRRSSSNPSFVYRGVNPSLVEILCPTTTLFLITILAEVLWSWGNKYSPLGCLEHTLALLLSLLNKIPWLENPMLWNRFQPSSL